MMIARLTCAPRFWSAVRRRLGREDRSDKGAVLILALVYIVVIGLTVAALTSWASNDLNNTTKFQETSSEHYALSSAMDTAIESERYAPVPTNPTSGQYTGTPLGECWQPATGTMSEITVNGYSIAVWCTTQITLASATTRTLSAYACLSSVSSTVCEASPSLSAVVSYDDYPDPAGQQLLSQCNVGGGQCGYSETLVSWTW